MPKGIPKNGINSGRFQKGDKTRLGAELSDGTKKEIGNSLRIYFKTHNNWNKGIEVLNIKGKDNPNWRGGISEKYCIDCGKKLAFYYAKRCRKCANKIQAKRMYGKRGKNTPGYGNPPPHGRGAYYKGIWMRSSWEINIAEWLDKQGWDWLYEPKRFELKDMTYLPDFYLPEQDVWWEVKGWFHERSQKQIKQFRELYPNERLVVITEEIYLKILEV